MGYTNIALKDKIMEMYPGMEYHHVSAFNTAEMHRL